MKSFSQYIVEQFEKSILVRNLEVHYFGPSKLYIEAPKNFSEDEMQNYLDDLLLEQLPAGNDAEKYFGANKSNIIDVYIEYDSINEAMGEDQKADIEYSARDNSNNDSDELIVWCIENFIYTVSFDTFELTNVDSMYVDNELKKIFERTISDKLPVKLEITKESISYNKDK